MKENKTSIEAENSSMYVGDKWNADFRIYFLKLVKWCKIMKEVLGMHEALEQYMSAIKTGNFEQFAKCLNEKIVFYFGNETCVGIEQIKKCFEDGADAIKDEKYWATDINYLHEDQSTLICVYKLKYSGYVNGRLIEGDGRASNVFIKNKTTGNWELIHEYRDGYQ